MAGLPVRGRALVLLRLALQREKSAASSSSSPTTESSEEEVLGVPPGSMFHFTESLSGSDVYYHGARTLLESTCDYDTGAMQLTVAGEDHRQRAEEHHAGEHDARAGAVVLRDVPVDLLDIGRARIGVDDHREEHARSRRARPSRRRRSRTRGASAASARSSGSGTARRSADRRRCAPAGTSPSARPIATAGMAPMRKPATTRQSVTTVCHGSSPQTQSSQNRSRCRSEPG